MLALEGNATYNYRSVSDEKAREVLGTTPKQICSEDSEVAYLGKTILGFYAIARYKDKPNVGELTKLFVAPEHFNKGVGTLLFRRAVQHARDTMHLKRLEWESDPFATEFYKKMGAKFVRFNLCPLNPKYQASIFSLDLSNA